MRVLVLSGSGRTADPWHPYAATSAAIARVAEDAGFTAEIVHGPLEGLARLAPGGAREAAAASAARTDELAVIVVNAGDHLTPLPEGAVDPGPPSAELLAAASAGLRAALDAGVGLLGVHAAASTLRELPGFGEALGVRWERGVSWHPPFGRLLVEPEGDGLESRAELRPGSRAEPDGAGPQAGPLACRERLDEAPPSAERAERYAPPFALDAPFELDDERYSDLRIAADAAVIARCADDDGVHPLVLAREQGAARVVYSALGHDERAFTSAAHRVLLASALRWAARR